MAQRSAPAAGADFVWKVSDSSVVSATPIDSIHASIQGLRPGTATVTPMYKSTRETLPLGVRVTVVR